MRRLAATMIVLNLVGSTTPTMARVREPVCREPSVVDEIVREIRSQNYYGSVDPKLVTEQPSGDPELVRCQVCVESAPYDTVRFGDKPIAQCLRHDFEVRILSTGFVVRDLRPAVP
jgi:hypothetical protein